MNLSRPLILNSMIYNSLLKKLPIVRLSRQKRMTYNNKSNRKKFLIMNKLKIIKIKMIMMMMMMITNFCKIKITNKPLAKIISILFNKNNKMNKIILLIKNLKINMKTM